MSIADHDPASITSDLAATDPLVENEPATDICGYSCFYCGGYTDAAFLVLIHDPDCLWQRAVEFVAIVKS